MTRRQTMQEKKEILIPKADQPYAVPENWQWVRLKEITEKISDGSHNPPPNSHTGIPLLSAANIYNNCINVSNVQRWITQEEYEQENKRTDIEPNDILLTIVGTLGRSAVVNQEKFALQRSVAVLKVKQYINPFFLKLFLDTPYIQNFLLMHAKGTAQKGFYLKALEQLSCIVAPKEEQDRIVQFICQQFSELDKAKEKVQDVLDSSETRKAAILHKAFTGELTASWRKNQRIYRSSWRRYKIGDLCDVVRGGSPRPAGSLEFYGGNIPFMKVADITRNNSPWVNSTEYFIKEAGLKKTRLVEANTLLLTNSGATLGVPAICTFQTTFNDGIAAFLNLDPQSVMFFYYFWSSKTKQLRAINKGAAQPNLNTDIIKNVGIELPSLEEQREIVRIVDELLAKEQRVTDIAKETLAQIDTMKQAILAKAFRGELGTNDPAEPPVTLEKDGAN